MYGVWYFANCMRGALSLGVIIMLWLYEPRRLQGDPKTDHLWAIGQLMLTFTVFWAYISFSQYFLIWNANVPEETFWYNIREYGDWWYVSLFLVFGNFLLPFLAPALVPLQGHARDDPADRLPDPLRDLRRHLLQHPAGAEGREGQPAAVLLAEPPLGRSPRSSASAASASRPTCGAFRRPSSSRSATRGSANA